MEHQRCETCTTELTCRKCAADGKRDRIAKAGRIEVHHRKAAARAINSDRCGCGKPKFHGSVGCPECWVKLPRELQAVLAHMLRAEFVIALAEAQTILGVKPCTEAKAPAIAVLKGTA